METAVLDDLDTALDAVIATLDTLVDVPAAGLGEVVLRLDRARERVAVAAGVAIGVFDAAGVCELDLDRSPTTWLAKRTGERSAHVGSRVKRFRKLRHMPHTSTALTAGKITESHAQVLQAAINPRTADAFVHDEEQLVDWATQLTADQLKTLIQRWLHHVDIDGPEPHDPTHNDQFHYRETTNGALTGEFSFGPTRAAEIKALLDEAAATQKQADEHLRHADPTDPLIDQPASRRNARALYELLRAGASAGCATTLRKPSLHLHATIDTLRGGAPIDNWTLEAEHAWHSLLPVDTAQLWACDSHIARIILDTDSVPLDVGRSKRTATPAQRRALAARDRGCPVPGCTVPIGRTDAHHLLHWLHGGPTDLDNLVLLCRHHHTRIHNGQLHVEMINRRPTFTLPDGRQLTRSGPVESVQDRA